MRRYFYIITKQVFEAAMVIIETFDNNLYSVTFFSKERLLLVTESENLINQLENQIDMNFCKELPNYDVLIWEYIQKFKAQQITVVGNINLLIRPRIMKHKWQVGKNWTSYFNITPGYSLKVYSPHSNIDFEVDDLNNMGPRREAGNITNHKKVEHYCLNIDIANMIRPVIKFKTNAEPCKITIEEWAFGAQD